MAEEQFIGAFVPLCNVWWTGMHKKTIKLGHTYYNDKNFGEIKLLSFETF